MKDVNSSAADLLAIVGPIGDNEPNLRNLIRQLRTGRGIVPFVGAGLSVPLGFPTWHSFLSTQASAAGITGEVEKLLEDNRYEDAAELLLLRRGRGAFNDAISNTYGRDRIRNRHISGAVSLLPHLAHGPVITTNFDSVLETAFQQAGAPFEREVWGAKASAGIQALHEERRFLLKIHGDADEITDRVLTRSDYEQHYGITDAETADYTLPIPLLIRAIMLTTPLLFLGCSLAQDRTMSVLHQVSADYPALRHYAVVEQPDKAEEYHLRAQFLSNHNIRPIWFPHRSYNLIEPLIQGLVNSGTPDLEQSLKIVQERLAQMDKHYIPQIILGAADVTITLMESYPGAAQDSPLVSKGVFVFPDTPQGRELQQQFEQLIRPEGLAQNIQIPGDYVQSFELPQPLRKVLSQGFGIHNLEITSVDLRPLPTAGQLIARLDFRCDDGDTYALPYVHLKGIAPQNDELVLDNKDQESNILVRLAVNKPARTSSINFSSKGAPAYVAQALEWLKLRIYLSKPVTITITDLNTRMEVLTERWPNGIAEAPNTRLVEQFEDLLTIQTRTKVPILVPEGPWSNEDRESIARLRTILHEGKLEGTWNGGSVSILSEGASLMLETMEQEGRNFIVMEQEATEQLFGLELPIGRVRVTYHDVVISNAEKVREIALSDAPADTYFTIDLRPGENQSVTWEYLDWLQEPASS